MQVELAEERLMLLADRFNMDHAEGRAWAKRTDAFGTAARLGGMLNRSGSDDYECVYRERRLQPIWRLHSRAVAVYERMRNYLGAGRRRGARGRHCWPVAHRRASRAALQRIGVVLRRDRARGAVRRPDQGGESGAGELSRFSARTRERRTARDGGAGGHRRRAAQREGVDAGPRGRLQRDRPDGGRPRARRAADRRCGGSDLPAGVRLPLPPRRQGGSDRVRRAHRGDPADRRHVRAVPRQGARAEVPARRGRRGGESLLVPGTQLVRIVVEHGVKRIVDQRNREAEPR